MFARYKRCREKERKKVKKVKLLNFVTNGNSGPGAWTVSSCVILYRGGSKYHRGDFQSTRTTIYSCSVS